MLLKKECIIIDNFRFRLITAEDIPRITGFYLMGQGYGDMICMLPVIKKVAHILGRRMVIWTFRPEVFMGLPFAVPYHMDLEAVKKACDEGNLFIVSPVEGRGIPSRFTMHLIDQAAFTIIDLEEVAKEITLPEYGVDRNKLRTVIERCGTGKKVIIHPTSAAAIRSWPFERWKVLVERLLAEGIRVLSVGKSVDYIGEQEDLIAKKSHRLVLEHDNFIDLTDQLSLHETYAIIKTCDLVVTMDSGLLHMANATDTFVIAMFTDVDPHYRMRYKDGKVGYKTIALSLPCTMQYCASRLGYNRNKCRLSGDKSMCCLPQVDDVYAQVKKVLKG